MAGALRSLLSMLMLAAFAWCAALVWFVRTMPTEPLPSHVKTEAIIVLTGGADRVEHGIALLVEGAAPVLFISGVGKSVTEDDILRQHAASTQREKLAQMQHEMVLDKIANSTKTNAEQVAEFVRSRNLHSLRLITAHYHMKRSLLEFRHTLPGIALVPDPVSPAGFRRDQWWQHETSRRLVFSEFNKYWAVLLRGLF